jgi:triacylglycerol esterase/lipase EstA (alpha/beta hydrolase family)
MRYRVFDFRSGDTFRRRILAKNPSNDDVANLIMIGTPNAGSELADMHQHNIGF